jgi:hypothetical protein
MHDFRPELTNLMLSSRINCKSLRICNFHFMGCQLSAYGVQLSPYGCTHTACGFTHKVKLDDVFFQ